jgi:glycosyltransferase involved in cell wall biosynthesis
MRILLVAPQPFYTERGTPIAVRLLAQTLCDEGHRVDLLTYHLGQDIAHPNLTLTRCAAVPGIRDVPIGISVKKLLCDVSLSVRMAQMLWSSRYDVVHAVEEALFPAVLLTLFSRCRLVYDMDSLLSEQVADKWRALRPLSAVLGAIERAAIRRCDCVLAVCEDLAVKVQACIPGERVVVLPDVPMPRAHGAAAVEQLRLHVRSGQTLLLYVGNLERYQGMDLMLQALQRVAGTRAYKLIIIGGERTHIEQYTSAVRELGLSEQVVFLGPRPLAALAGYLDQADVLVSPRTLGQNTPMKIYSYMQAGKAILATRIRSHTQVLDDSCALLTEPTPAALAAGVERLVGDPGLRSTFGHSALQRVESEFSLAQFQRKLRNAYARLAAPSET